MLLRVIISLILFLPGILKAQKNKYHYIITGKISGVSQRYIYLKPGYGPQYGSTDSIFSESGEFIFKGISKEICMRAIYVQGERLGFSFVLELGNITIRGNVSDMNNAIATGGNENKIYDIYRDWSKAQRKDYDQIIAKITQAKKNGDSASYKKHNDDWIKAGLIWAQHLEDFIQKYPGSYAALHICRNHTFGDPEMANRFLSHLTKSLHQHSVYHEVKYRAEIEDRIAIGKPAPEFSQLTLQNRKFSLSSLKGKYVLIDFWASWCTPCRKESENLVKIYKTFSEKGLEIVSISLDDNKKQWLKAVETDGYTWINVSDLKGQKNDVAILFGVSAIPKNYLVDRKGNIIAMNLTGESLVRKLQELLD